MGMDWMASTSGHLDSKRTGFLQAAFLARFW